MISLGILRIILALTKTLLKNWLTEYICVFKQSIDQFKA